MFLPGAFSMRVVVLFAAAVAVAVLAAALAAKLMPDAARLAYGEPMPYLKVAREGDLLKIWLEDYAGLKPRRVWLYVNGQLKAVDGPAYARCGDRVAALAQYEVGVRRVEAEVLCTKPIKAPGGVEQRRNYHLIQTAQAYNALTGEMDQTDLPIRISGWCHIWVDGAEASVVIEATRLDALICIGMECKRRHELRWSFWRETYVRLNVDMKVLKTPDAPLSQLLGGGRRAYGIEVNYYYVRYYNAYYLEVYLHPGRVKLAGCYQTTSVTKETVSFPIYREPNASGVYGTRICTPDGRVLDGTLILWQRQDGDWGFRVFTNPVADEQATDENCGSLTVPSRYGDFRFNVDRIFGLEEFFEGGPLSEFFFNYLKKDDNARGILADALYKILDAEYNVPREVAGNETVEYLVFHTTYSKQTGGGVFGFKTLSLSSLGAVYANVFIPLDIKLPPPKEPDNATRTYIFTYR